MKQMATVFAFLVLLVSGAAHADKPEISLEAPGFFSSDYKYALDGYDSVSYWTGGKPTKGSKEFSYEFKGATWLFANQENLDKFKANPDKYRPAYGNYCAYALANGDLAAGDPKVYHIKDGKLYLNYSDSVQEDWLEDVNGYIKKSDKNWPDALK